MTRHPLVAFVASLALVVGIPHANAAPAVAPGGATAAAVVVSAATPQGVLEGGEPQRVQLVFSRAMVALGEAESLSRPPAWLVVEPPIAARWRWAGTTELLGEQVSPWPTATTFRVTVQAGARAVDGSALAEAFSFSFSTPSPAASFAIAADESDEPRRRGRDEERLAPSSAISLTWNQPVDLASLVQAISVRVAPRPLPDAEALVSPSVRDHWRAAEPALWAAWQRFLAAARGTPAGTLDVTVEPDAERPTERFHVKPIGCWPVAATVVVDLAAGVRSLQGPRPAAAATASFATPWPFAPLAFAGRAATSGAGLDPSALELRLSTETTWRDLAPFLSGRDTASGAKLAPPNDPEAWYWTLATDEVRLWPLRLAGGSTYEVCLAPGATDTFGQILEFPWCGTVRTAHHAPTFYLVEGDGVVEWNGPHLLPLRSQNLLTYTVQHRRVGVDDLVNALKRREDQLAEETTTPRTVKLPLRADSAVTTPVDLDPALAGRPGIVMSQLAAGDVLPGSTYDEAETTWLRKPRTALTQVTSIGLTVKASGQAGILIWVTELQQAVPVAGAEVAVRSAENEVIWQGTTDASGLARTPDGVGLGRAFVVTARRGDDVAYARTRWWEGHRGWEFNLPVDDGERPPVAGLVFADRGAVRPGESVHLKAVLRRQDNRRLAMLPDASVTFLVRNSRDEEVLARPVPVNAAGGAELELPVPSGAPLGAWQVEVGNVLDPKDRRFSGPAAWSVAGSFRVAEFRRPKFRVRVEVGKDRLTAGDQLAATVDGTLLAGGAMRGAATRWVVRASRQSWRPEGTRWNEFEFVPGAFDDSWEEPAAPKTVAEGRGQLDDRGRLAVQLPRVEALKGWPARLEVEGEVSDVDRQSSAATASTTVAPGEFSLGVRRPPFFVQARDGVPTAVAAVTADGAPRAGVAVRVELKRRHWESVRRREVSGRFTYESREVVTSVASQEVTTTAEPLPVRFTLGEGGEYAIEATATDQRGNPIVASAAFYVFGDGFAPWRMDEENRIDLVAERDRFAPGDTARVLVKSPWERTTALVTVERAGVLESRVEYLEGTMPTISIPVLADYTPNVFVSVVLLRGRIDASATAELLDPGRPAYRVGYCELTVPPTGRRLAVTAKPARAEYRPGQTASVAVAVRDEDGAGRRANVTVWAVDAGVLDLTGYRTPDTFATFYARRGLGVSTAESRSRIVGRRSYGTKGARPGGGGGMEAGDAVVRRDFRALAVWRGDVATDGNGLATIEFPLPDSLTTYRLMVVAAAGEDRFGSGEVEFKVTKPLGLEPALPRFLRPDDRARAAVVVRNRTSVAQEVEVTLTLPDAGPVRLRGTATRHLTVAAGASAEAGFGLLAISPGVASLRFTAQTSSTPPQRDSFAVELPVLAAAAGETNATFLAVDTTAAEAIEVPSDAFPGSGGLELSLAASAALEAAPGVRFLADYPFGCAEQLASRLLGMTAAARLGEGFAPAELDGLQRSAWTAMALSRLAACQRGDGGFATWPDAPRSSVELSTHVAWALAAAGEGGNQVDAAVVERAAAYLGAQLRRETWPLDPDYGWTVRTLAVAGLVRLGRGEPAYFQALFDERTARGLVWPRAVLADAMLRVNPADPRAAVLLREVRNSIVVEARTARLEETPPQWGWRVWWSDERGSAAALLALLGGDPGNPVNDRLARGIADRLARGWAVTTHEAAWMLQSLAAYHTRREGASARTATATLGSDRVLRAAFAPGKPARFEMNVPMARLQELAARATDRRVPLKFVAEGGTVHAAAVLSYTPRGAARPPLARGLTLARRFVDAQRRTTAGVAAGDEVSIEIAVDCPATRRFVVVEVPLPAGLEPFDPRLATTARRNGEEGEEEDDAFWRPGFDHVELRDDRVVLFATELPAGTHRTSVRCRATTAGTFLAASPRAAEMYAPEVFATGSAAAFEIAPPPRP